MDLRLQVSKTVSYSVLASDNGTDFNNSGASSTVTFTLPGWAPGLEYAFSNPTNQTIIIAASGTDVIEMSSVKTVGGGSVTSTMQYSELGVTGVAPGVWQVTKSVGGWSLT